MINMRTTFEPLWASTADLLYRARKYDRHQQFARELSEFSEVHRLLGQMKLMAGGDHLAEGAAEKLRQIRRRLLTIMEDLLYTAV